MPPECHLNVVVNWRWSGRNFNQISITYLPADTGHNVRPNNWRFAVRLGQGSVALQQLLFQGTGEQFQHWPIIGPSDISSTFGHLMCSGVRLAHFTNPMPVSIDWQWPSGSGQKNSRLSQYREFLRKVFKHPKTSILSEISKYMRLCCPAEVVQGFVPKNFKTSEGFKSLTIFKIPEIHTPKTSNVPKKIQNCP